MVRIALATVLACSSSLYPSPSHIYTNTTPSCRLRPRRRRPLRCQERRQRRRKAVHHGRVRGQRRLRLGVLRAAKRRHRRVLRKGSAVRGRQDRMRLRRSEQAGDHRCRQEAVRRAKVQGLEPGCQGSAGLVEVLVTLGRPLFHGDICISEVASVAAASC